MNARNCSKIALALLAAFLSLAQALLAHADAAPPWQPPGASIDPGQGDFVHVQMMSEQVLLSVNTPGAGGQVEARFVMRNQGESEESFDVWFPLGVNGVRDTTEIKNFGAWVDGVPATVSRKIKNDPIENQPVPWAAWPTTFLPGQDVILRVTFNVTPVEWDTFSVYHYILETGAGWWGPIGEGSITFRYPYEINPSNAVFKPYALETGKVCDHPSYFTVSGTDVTWSFKDLEPTPEDNICLSVLRPALWQEITAARDEAAANPDSIQAHLRLARAQAAALPTMPGIFGAVMHIGSSIENAELALAAYEQTLLLDPTNIDVYAEYLELLAMALEPDYETWLHQERLYSALERALQLAPEDQRLRSIAERVQQIASIHDSSPAPTPPTPSSPLPTATFTSSSILPTPTPPAAKGDSGKPCPGIIALVLAPLGILVVQRARRK